MSKGLKYSLIGLACIILVAFLILSYSLDNLVKSEIESTGSEMMQTSVTVENVSISPFSGTGTIQGLRVKNPEGFESEYAIVIGSLDIAIDISTLLSDTLLINEILIGEPALSVIQKVPQNNLKMLMNNMDEAITGESASSSAMIIEYLRVENGQVTVTPNIGGERSAGVKMESFVLENVGKEGSSSTKQVVRQIATKLVDEAIRAALSGQLDGLKDKAKDALKDIFND